MKDIKVIINGKECPTEKGEFLLDVAKRNGINIPHLCHHEFLRGQATCRICIVEVNENGRKKIVTSCVFPVTKDILVETNTDDIKTMRKTLLSLLVAEVPDNKEILYMAKEYGVNDFSRFEISKGNECIMCGLCVRACEELGCSAIATINRGITKTIATPYEEASPECIGCGSCAFVCPSGCIKIEEDNGIRRIWNKEFKLLSCGICGKPFMTKEYYDFMSKKQGTGEGGLVCASCKRKEIPKQMMGAFKNTIWERAVMK